ncbi:hypothetical protein [uncultured Celeribacter sp.]|uniref:COG4315 family predicted lipoprotein n=1 Tax=uncultured Celeribacter sp. TaxID=1303376 RepID=UPI002AA60E4C|nr:hypothetical protein [uncultured Celeribacter sp.]
MLKIPPYAAVLAAFATTAFAADAPVVTGKLGEDTYLMVADTHMTLYTFDKDEKGVSNCYDECAGLWPPVIGEAGMELPKGYSLISRKDGTEQVAYKGQPLYLWVKDVNPGDMTGDGVKDVWHIARP